MNTCRSQSTRRDFRVAVPESTRRAMIRLKVRLGETRRVGELLHVNDSLVWDALVPMGIMRPEALDRIQARLRAIGEEP